MKKNPLSNKSIKFFKRNSLNFENAREYVRNLCKAFEFLDGNYEIKDFCNDELGLFVYLKNEYVVYFDIEETVIKILKNNKLRKIFEADDCWFQALKMIEREESL